MNSRNHSDDLLDIGLQHTLKNWVARKDAPTKGREKLLVAAARQSILPKSNNAIKYRFDTIFQSASVLSERSVFPGYGYALDMVYAVKVSMTIA